MLLRIRFKRWRKSTSSHSNAKLNTWYVTHMELTIVNPLNSCSCSEVNQLYRLMNTTHSMGVSQWSFQCQWNAQFWIWKNSWISEPFWGRCVCTFMSRKESQVNKMENILIEFFKQLNDWFKPNTEMHVCIQYCMLDAHITV